MDPVGVLRGHEQPVTALAAVTLANGDVVLVSGFAIAAHCLLAYTPLATPSSPCVFGT